MQVVKRFIIGVVLCSSFVCDVVRASGWAEIQEIKLPQGSLLVQNAWIRKTLPVQKTSALYFSLVNQSSDSLELKSVSIPVASRTMIHQTIVENGIAKMRHADNLIADVGENLSLKPGGLHVMLMGLSKPLEAGKQIEFTLHFANGMTVNSVAKVQ